MIYDTLLKDHRLPSAEESELLMGIDKYYTVGAIKEKFESRNAFVIRRQLIGNSFNCCVVSFILGDLLATKFGIPLPAMDTHAYLGPRT